MKKIINTLSYSLLGIIILFILLIFINIFFFNNKYKVSLVLSGSMEPDISVNDLVILKSTDKFNVNDIVSYKDTSGKVVMHRIIKIDGNKVITKGDANNVSDKEIDKSQITGIYVYNIKYLGKIIKLIKTPIGLLLVLLLIVLIIFIPTGKDIVFNKKKVIGVSSVLLVIIFSCILGYYSQYKKNYSGKGVGEVARIRTDRSQSLKIDTTDLYPGFTSRYYFGIKNSKDITSEVGIKYSIKINSTNNIPLKYSIKCLDKTDGTCLTKDNINVNEVVDAGIMNLKDTTHSYELSISWPETYNDVSYMNELEVIKIDIVAEQID